MALRDTLVETTALTATHGYGTILGMGKELLNTSQAADRLGVTDSWIRHMIRLGLLRATKWGRDWQITPTDLDECASREKSNAGRPPSRRKPKQK
jgi:excisionase family DNA binding protein